MKRRLISLALAGVATWGCKGDEQLAPKAQAQAASSAAPAEAPAPKVAKATTPLSSPIVARLPKDVRLVLAGRAPAELLKLVDYANLLARFERVHGAFRSDLTKTTGYDLTDPKVLADVLGFDLGRPVGFYVSRFNTFQFGLFAHVTHADRFDRGLTNMVARLPKPFAAVERAGAKVWQNPRGEFAIVRRGDEVHLLSQDGRNPHLLTAAVNRLLEADAKTSLGASDDFTHAASDLTVGRDAALYLNINQVIASIVAEVTGSARVQRLRDEIAAMEASGAEPDRLAARKARLARMERRSLERLAEGTAVSLAINTFAGGMSALAMGAQLDADSIEFEAGVRTLETALIQRLLKPGAAAPLALSALSKPPVYNGRVHFDVEGLVGLIRQAVTLAGGGSELQRGLAHFKGLTGLDLEAEVLPLLTGAVELGFDFASAPAAQPDDEVPPLEHRARPNLLIGLTDEAKAKALLDRYLAKGQIKGTQDASGRWRIEVPAGVPPVHVEITRGHLVISTQPGFAEGLGGAGCTDQLAPASVRARATAAQTSAHYFDWPGLALLTETHAERFRARWNAKYRSRRTHANVTPEVAKQLAALDAEQWAKTDAWHQADSADNLASLALLGPLGASFDIGDRSRASLRLSQGLKAAPGAVLAKVVQHQLAIETRNRDRWRVDNAYNERRRALREGRPDPGP